MNSRLLAPLAVIAAVAAGAAGYYFGSLKPAPASAPAMAQGQPVSPATPVAMPGAAPKGAEVVAMTAFSDAQKDELGQVIRDYLLSNPEIVREAINELQRREDAAQQAAQVKAITDSGDLIFSSTRQVILGNPKGNVTLVEFFDYNCGYCRRAHDDMKRLIEGDPNLRVVLKEFPVLGDGSVQAAQVAVAIQLTAPEKYWDFHDAMLSEQGQVNKERALAVAEEIGLDAKALEAKIETPEVKATLAEVYELAGKLNLTGTPSYVTKKEVIVGAVGFDQLKAKVEAARACGAASC